MNIIVIVLDSLRTDYVGCYGGKAKTPNIDAFAGQSAVFENAYSENLPTLPCRAAWWTGRHLFPWRGWQPLEVDDVLLAEILSVHGFESALVTDTYHMRAHGYNYGRGFDTTLFVRGQEYDPWIRDPSVEVDLGRWHRLRGDETDRIWKPRFEQYLRNRSTIRRREDHFVARLVTEAVRWLEHVGSRRKDRIFLWLDSFSPHEAWDPPEPYRRMYDPDYTGRDLIDPVPGTVEGYMTEEELRHTKSLYAGVISFVDEWIGVLFDALRGLDLYENSLIVLMSDHGEPFGEHGYIRKCRPECHEQLTHIPWIMRHPDGIGAGRRYGGFVQPPDLLPTILDAAGFDLNRSEVNWGPLASETSELRLDGRSLLPILSGETGSIREFAVSAFHGAQWSLRTEEWALLLPLNDPAGTQLYHRPTDLEERTNVLEEHPDTARDLEKMLRNFVRELEEKGQTRDG